MGIGKKGRAYKILPGKMWFVIGNLKTTAGFLNSNRTPKKSHCRSIYEAATKFCGVAVAWHNFFTPTMPRPSVAWRVASNMPCCHADATWREIGC